MTIHFAVAGKGGSGKTTFTALVIRYLALNGYGPLLAVDADPNSNLGESLGIELRGTIGKVLDDFQNEKLQIPPGMNKQLYLEYKLNETIAEKGKIDLLTMGRGEGSECYCYPNVILRKMISELSHNYRYVVTDNEAGLEHLSRRTTKNIDVLFLVSNHTVKGIRAVARVRELAEQLHLDIRRQKSVVTGTPDLLDKIFIQEAEKLGIPIDYCIPDDTCIRDYDLSLKPLVDLSDDAVSVQAVNRIMQELLK